MINTKTAIMSTVFKCSSPLRNYSKISINKMRKILSTIYGINVGRRWIFRCLEELEELGFLNRLKRYKKCAEFPYGQQSSLWSITLKGARALSLLGVKGAGKILRQIKEFIKSDDNRWPKAENSAEQFTPEQILSNKGRLKAIISDLA